MVYCTLVFRFVHLLVTRLDIISPVAPSLWAGSRRDWGGGVEGAQPQPQPQFLGDPACRLSPPFYLSLVLNTIIFNNLLELSLIDVVIYKWSWIELLVGSYCLCAHVTTVLCTCASPLHGVWCILRFCTTHPLLRARDGKDEFFHCGEDSVTGAEIYTWLGCHGYPLPVASFVAWHSPFSKVLPS